MFCHSIFSEKFVLSSLLSELAVVNLSKLVSKVFLTKYDAKMLCTRSAPIFDNSYTFVTHSVKTP